MFKFIKNHKAVFCTVLAVALVVTAWVVKRVRAEDRVTLVEITRAPIVEAVYGIGTVQAARTFQLKVGFAGVIDRILVQEGDVVGQGAPLVSIDGTRTFSSPIDGTVTELFFKERETVFPQAPILTITDIKERYLQVSLEQQGAIRTEPGQQVKLSFESLRDQAFNGQVESVYSADGRFLVRIKAEGLPASILPGMTADVSIVIKTHDDAVLVPIKAINLGKVMVRKNKSSKANEMNIKTGIVDGEMAQIMSSELQVGDLVEVRKE